MCVTQGRLERSGRCALLLAGIHVNLTACVDRSLVAAFDRARSEIHPLDLDVPPTRERCPPVKEEANAP